ncbi:meiotic recombination protein REC8 homolog [Notolabrus celidotus]|uniref:meiotic recombination protein REC8 homolog n=1 Tax=Notolabrus celidotus TaxID=1203425 RepID=UPI00148FF892|nr:meiotic recombination protein REC8 homolog [Notolabrus celidotus]
MFYYPPVLIRNTGCFSTIWLVATNGYRVTRRDFLKVNVIRTCDDLMNFVLERVPPSLPDLPRPRFSLYLSSQLQYGVVRVYHRQCAILLEELQDVVGRLAKQRTKKMDIDDHSRLALDLPDALSHLEESEGAPDPLFGVMYMRDAMPSPNTLIQMGREFLRETSPEHAERVSPASAAASDIGITASPENITLRETEPAAMPITEYEGVDLLEQHPATIDLLLDQMDNFLEGDLELSREAVTLGEQEREMERAEREGDLEREGTKEPTGSTIELQPTTTLSGEDAMFLPQEESGPPADQITPISVPPVPSPEPPTRGRERQSPVLEDVPPATVRKGTKRKKRQLIFIDPETQILQEVLEEQIKNLQTETRKLSYPLLPHQRMIPAAELLNRPCTLLPAEVQFLWKRAATVTSLSGSDLQVGERGPESTDSERERQGEAPEAAEIEEGRFKLSPMEVPRDVAEAEMFDFSAHGSLPLEVSDQREMSREASPMHTSDREETPISRSVPTLQDIPEVPDEMLAAEPLGLLPEELTEDEDAPQLFQSLLAPNVGRRTVSNIFQRLLETLSTGKFCVEQNEPYGDIWILPGPNYKEAVLTVTRLQSLSPDF